ncbi:MAG: hypothetical protein QG599_3648 [Pseudomonadota bacterium]|nr:hypothetical protein [Pseudomonadota bacterium]
MTLQPHPQHRCYVLTDDLAVTVDDLTVHVPAGFPCDGASLPPLAWPLLYQAFDPRVMIAATVHDWLYYTHSQPRPVADALLETLLLQGSAARFKARVISGVVRLLGRWFWPNTAEDEQLLRELYQRHQHRPDVDKFGFPLEVMK